MGGAGECCDAICYKATSMSAPIPIKNSTMSPNPTQEVGGTHNHFNTGLKLCMSM